MLGLSRPYKDEAKRGTSVGVYLYVHTRAVHLEVAWDLDTVSFLNAFTRFTSRPGIPIEMLSDNDINFVGAVNELKELVCQLDKDKIKRNATNVSVKWNFNPPAAPPFSRRL
jgi:hypothetical protein